MTTQLNMSGFEQVRDKHFFDSPFQWAAVSAKVAATNLAEAAEVLALYSTGKLVDAVDFFGEPMTAESQMETASTRLAEAKARLDALITMSE